MLHLFPFRVTFASSNENVASCFFFNRGNVTLGNFPGTGANILINLQTVKDLSQNLRAGDFSVFCHNPVVDLFNQDNELSIHTLY